MTKEQAELSRFSLLSSAPGHLSVLRLLLSPRRLSFSYLLGPCSVPGELGSYPIIRCETATCCRRAVRLRLLAVLRRTRSTTCCCSPGGTSPSSRCIVVCFVQEFPCQYNLSFIVEWVAGAQPSVKLTVTQQRWSSLLSALPHSISHNSRRFLSCCMHRSVSLQCSLLMISPGFSVHKGSFLEAPSCSLATCLRRHGRALGVSFFISRVSSCPRAFVVDILEEVVHLVCRVRCRCRKNTEIVCVFRPVISVRPVLSGLLSRCVSPSCWCCCHVWMTGTIMRSSLAPRRTCFRVAGIVGRCSTAT